MIKMSTLFSIKWVGLSIFLLAHSFPLHAEEPPVMPEPGVHIIPEDSQSFTPEMKAEDRKERTDMQTKGYVDATDDEVEGLEKYKREKKVGNIRPIQEIEGKITFKLASGGSSQELKLDGAVAHGAYADGKWTMVTRFFTTKQGTTVTLEEWDYITAGGGVYISQEAINADINGHPAILVIKQSSSGKAVTTLTWFTDQKGYILTTSDNVKKKGTLQEFLDLAKSVQG